MINIYKSCVQEYMTKYKEKPYVKFGSTIFLDLKLPSGTTVLEQIFKVRGPFVETPRIFLCMQNINYAEILA